MEIEDFNYLKDLEFVDPDRGTTDKVFTLYQKYIDKNVWSYNTGCECSNSIVKFYHQLMEYVKNNPPL